MAIKNLNLIKSLTKVILCCRRSRQTIWLNSLLIKSVLTVLLFLISTSGVFAEGLGGLASFNYNSIKVEEDGQKQSTSRTLNQNLHLNYNKTVTPNISYQLYLRANTLDMETTDVQGTVTDTDRRMVEPAIDFYLRNSIYFLSAGYRRQEEWSSHRLKDENRETTELYYSRLNFIPDTLPSLSLDYDRQENFDYLTPKNKDRTFEEYSISSDYVLPPGDIRARYHINFTHSIDKNPNELTNKITSNNFNANYHVEYSGYFWHQRANYSVSYRGNYSRDDNKQFLNQTGSFLTKRSALGGFNDRGSGAKPDVDFLPSLVSLVDDNFITSTGIDISTLITGQYQNLGIRVSGTKPVDTIYVYVNQDVSGDVLKNSSSWKAYSSDVNINVPNTWTERTIQSITVSSHDISNSIYRFEIKLSSEVTASYFKVINLVTSSVANVAVTEIEAYGTEIILNTETTDKSKAYTQGINLRTNARLYENVTLALHYTLDRTDRNPDSVLSSMGGILKNVFSDEVSGDDAGFRSVIIRDYGATAIWEAHRLLTTSLRIQRNESFDDLKTNDFASNSYNLSFNSAPLPTLDATLSLLRNDTYKSDNKENETNSVLLSIGSRLHRDVNMINDASYTKSKSISADTTSESYIFDGSIDANITRRLSGSMNYGFLHTKSGGSSSDSKNAFLIINYRPGRFINISGNARVLDSAGVVTTSTGVITDWIPLPAFRVNINYVHTNSDASPSRSDSFTSYLVWYIAKSADLRFTYNFTERVDRSRTNSYSYNYYLNWRF